MKNLTKEQAKILDFVIRQKRVTGSPPTIREIASHFGYKSPNNASQHLRLIEQKGYIKRLPGKARSIEIIGYTEINENTSDIPIVGDIAAGTPITAIENIDGNIALDNNLFKGENLFALKVKGDSMKDIGILNGDIAIIHKQPSVTNGEIAAVIVEDEATLKRFTKTKNSIVLKAENPAYTDIVVEPEKEVQIAGKLTGVMRKC